MFLGGLAAPVPAHGLLRPAWLYPIVREMVTRRSSKNRDAGVSCLENVEMTRAVFVDMMFTKLLPDVLRSTKGFATRIVFQVDNAGGHGGGRGSLENKTFPELRELVRSMTRARKAELWGNPGTFPEIVFVAQPPTKSPDLQRLRLGWMEVDRGSGDRDCFGRLQLGPYNL